MVRPSDNDAFIKRKSEHILREREERQALGRVRNDHISRTRTWAVTLFAAYFAFTAGFNGKSTFDADEDKSASTTVRDANDVDTPRGVIGDARNTEALVVPLAGAIVLFWIMEGFTDALGKLNMSVYKRINDIFSKRDEEDFRRAIEDYEFADNCPGKEKWWLPKGGKIDRFTQGCLRPQAIFYGIPLCWLLFANNVHWWWRCLFLVFAGLLVTPYIVYKYKYECIYKRLNKRKAKREGDGVNS